MNTQSNPFARGYQNLTFRRVLMIAYDDDCPAAYRQLHPSQANLPDDKVQRFPCVFCDDFALITEGQDIPDDLDEKCQLSGVVQIVLYEINADDFGTPMHVGDTYSAEAARQVIERLTFETGFYSRSWEISSAHLPVPAIDYLEALADRGTPTGLLFETFRVPGCYAVGCKLLCTPWTDKNLADIEGSGIQELRQQQLSSGVLESVVDLLHLAALGDTRFLILDPDAPTLNGLPVYEH